MPIAFELGEPLGQRLQLPDVVEDEEKPQSKSPDLSELDRKTVTDQIVSVQLGRGPLLDAAFSLGNSVSAAGANNENARDFDDLAGIYSAQNPGAGFDPAYDPFTDIKGYEQFADSFIHANSANTVSMIKAKIDRENKDRQTIEAAGFVKGTLAMMVAGALDPVYLPLMFARPAQGAGIIKTAIQASAIGATGASVQEAALHSSQETRTKMESAFNIGGATLLSGILGAAGARLSRLQFDNIAKAVDDDISGAIDVSMVGQAAGAAARRNTTMAQETMTSTLGVARATKNVSPLLRTLQSESLTARQVGQELFESHVGLAKHEQGVITPDAVETAIRMHDARIGSSFEKMDSLYVSYRTGDTAASKVALSVKDLFGARRRSQQMTMKDFREQIGESLRNNDTHSIPQVQQAAQYFRKTVFDPLKNDAINLGILDENVKAVGSDSYLTRVYKHNVIKERRPEFRNIIFNWLKSGQRSAEREALSLQNDLTKVMTGIERANHFDDIKILSREAGHFKRAGLVGEEAINRSKIEEIIKSLRLDSKFEKDVLKRLGKTNDFLSYQDSELLGISDEVINNILGHPGGTIPRNVVPIAGPLKERTLTIPDAMIKDFLESDIELVARRYVQSMAPEIELTRRFGSKDMRAQIADIETEYAGLAAKAKTPKIARAITEEGARTVKDIAAMRDVLIGNYAAPVDPDSFFAVASSTVRKVNYLRMLGMMTLGAVSDVANPVMVHGLRRWGKGLSELASHPKKFGMAAREVKQAGAAWDMVLNTRARSLADIGDHYGTSTAVQRGLDKASTAFGVATLMTPWNAAMKQFGGVLSAHRFLEESLEVAGGTASKKSIAYLARSGIDEGMAGRIVKQFNKYGEKGDVWLSKAANWDDVEAARIFRTAIVKEADRLVVTPGAGDLPLIARHWKVASQFRSFGFAAVNRILLPQLQQRDLATLNGTLLSVALGAAAYGARSTVSGQEISDDPSVVIANAVDRSGMLGYLMDVNNIMEKATRGRVGISALTGGPQMSRYASRNAVGAILGPTFGTGQDMMEIVGSISAGDVKRKDIHLMRKMLPYQNLFYLRNLFDSAESGAADALGVNE